MKKNVLLAPAEAIVRSRERTLVRLPVKGAEPETREISIGATDGRNVHVIEGLKEGETILLAGGEKGKWRGGEEQGHRDRMKFHMMRRGLK